MDLLAWLTGKSAGNVITLLSVLVAFLAAMPTLFGFQERSRLTQLERIDRVIRGSDALPQHVAMMRIMRARLVERVTRRYVRRIDLWALFNVFSVITATLFVLLIIAGLVNAPDVVVNAIGGAVAIGWAGLILTGLITSIVWLVGRSGTGGASSTERAARADSHRACGHVRTRFDRRASSIALPVPHGVDSHP